MPIIYNKTCDEDSYESLEINTYKSGTVEIGVETTDSTDSYEYLSVVMTNEEALNMCRTIKKAIRRNA